ncbi:MAG: hypothetical protein US53_C0037G0021, partial [Candidatus Woesebacteria bacterium GW2011_GWA1_37_7]
KLHKIMDNRNPDKRNKQLDSEHNHYYSPRHGWGKFRNLTRRQYTEHVAMLIEQTVNRTLIDAEIKDEKPFQTNFLKSLF